MFTNEGWLPHVERFLIFVSIASNCIILLKRYKTSDNSLELRFITRDDFRRVEAKLDTVINIAAYIGAEQRFKPTPRRRKSVDSTDK